MEIMRKARMATTLAGATVALAAGATPAMADDAVIKVRDACDPRTFDAVIGEGTCVRGDGGDRVTIDALFAEVAQDGEHGAWSFTEKAQLDEGESLRVRFDRGGEAHSFTPVDGFGPGCVPELNALMGFDPAAPPAADCALIGPTIVGPMRTAFGVDGLDTGTHRFMCLIHPWMNSTVTVRAD
jgi:hypothetical protein